LVIILPVLFLFVIILPVLLSFGHYIACPLSFGHYISCPFSIYGLYLPLWYIQSFLRHQHIRYMPVIYCCSRIQICTCVDI
jgi:hypothetical protein